MTMAMRSALEKTKATKRDGTIELNSRSRRAIWLVKLLSLETLYQDREEVTHTDIEDKDQSVNIRKLEHKRLKSVKIVMKMSSLRI